jgi:hypothetical protein
VSWRKAKALATFVAAVDKRYPKRDRASDGTIGDAAHASRASDHNPWLTVDGVGVVRAVDIDKDGIAAAWLAEQLRKLGAAGDPRLTGGGYVIFNRRITSADFSHWREYTGANPHTSHIHVSFSRNRAGFDSAAGWPFLAGTARPAPARPVKRPSGARPNIQRGSTHPRYVKDIQRRLKTFYPAYARHLTVDGVYGPKTEAAVREFQRRSGLAADGIVGQRTWKALGF